MPSAPFRLAPILKPADDTHPFRPTSGPTSLDSATIAALFVQHSDELRRFLFGVLRHHEQATDAMQIAFAKAIEQGHNVQREALKSWLFRVAYHEAIVIKRKQAIAQRASEKIAHQLTVLGSHQAEAPELNLVRWETVAAVRASLEQLPIEQRQVVRMRIYEQKKFIEIATELGLPLGTVLTRMQLALKKLKKYLGERP